MVARLTLIFLIFLSLELGIIGDWGDNYLLAVAADKTGIPALQTIVASGWVRGAVTGLGILNVLIAFWEIANFKRGVEMLEGKKPEKREPRAENRE
jgi:hypothetical protein